MNETSNDLPVADEPARFPWDDRAAICEPCSADGLRPHRCGEPDTCPCGSVELHDAGVVAELDEAAPDAGD